jgi:tetratricopeptide (TPR) repeat protein
MAKKEINEKKSDNDTLIKIIIVVFSFILYSQTVKFDFVLDDESFYTQNTLVQNGLDNWIDFFISPSIGEQSQYTSNQPYRPITILVFAIEHTLFGDNAGALHFFNLLIYTLLLLVLYATLKKLFTSYSSHIIAVIVLLYAVHPVHSEVVANIKTLDEMLAALFGYATWYYFLNISQNDSFNLKNTLLFFTFSLLTIFSKESGIVFFAIIPLSLLLIKKIEVKKVFIYGLPFVVSTIIFFLFRHYAVSSQLSNSPLPVLDNVLYIADSMNEKIATRLLTLYLNIKTLVIPYPLTWDYTYRYVYVANFFDYHVIASILIYTLMLFACIYNWKKNPAFSFFTLFFFIGILPTSNIFFINSTNFAERFLFVASLAFPVIILMFLKQLFKIDFSSYKFTFKNRYNYLIVGLLLLFSGMTVKATSYWKSNLILFEHGVKVSGSNTRAHYNLGQEYWKLAQRPENAQANNEYAYKAIDEFKKSLKIYPRNFMAMTNLACLYDLTNNLDSSIYFFSLSQKIYPKQPVINKNIAAIYIKKASIYVNESKIDSAESNYQMALSYDPTNVVAWNNLGLIFYNRANLSNAIAVLEKGLKANPENITLLETCAVISFLSKDYQKAIEYGLRGLKIDAQSKKLIGVLADANHAIGNNTEVLKYQQIMNTLN